MYNRIQHFLGFGINKIEKDIKEFLNQGRDFGEFVLKMEENLHELGRNICSEVMEDIDKVIKEDDERKKDWDVERKDEIGTIITIFGKVEYKRTYYKSKSGKGYCHLVDEFAGIGPHDRISTDVVVRTLEEVTDSSYKKTGEKVVLTDEISKQTVMNIVKDTDEIRYQLNPQEEKKKVKKLYIEADEDHVQLQKGGTIMPRLVYVHEGLENDGLKHKRKRLMNARYFGWVYSNNEELWLEVAQYIDDYYDTDYIEKIYLAGDGAPWIRQGLNWIDKSEYVLDKYHLKKYVLKSTGHVPHLRQNLKDAIDDADKRYLKEIFKEILSETIEETKKESVKEARRYMLRNWDGIEIYETDRYDVIGCSAEGHVSHILSARLSSRPMGWSEECVDKMSRLRIYRKNGGKIIDLVKAKKIKEEKEQKQEISKELRNTITRKAKSYYNGGYNNITVLNLGKKNALYNELKAFQYGQLA